MPQSSRLVVAREKGRGVFALIAIHPALMHAVPACHAAACAHFHAFAQSEGCSGDP